MFSSDFSSRLGRTPLLALALTIALAGCESKQDKAIDQAKKQAQVSSCHFQGSAEKELLQNEAASPDGGHEDSSQADGGSIENANDRVAG